MLRNTKIYQNSSTKGSEAILERFEVKIKAGMDRSYFQQSFSGIQQFGDVDILACKHSSFVLKKSAVPILIVICGATATGKSRLAIALSQRFQSAILSADSRQVYREFDIGTAKPPPAEQQQVPHRLIDICNPTETLTLADYQQQAQQIISKFHQSGDRFSIPLLVGGTGLYIRAITQGLQIPRVPPQLELRSQLQTLGQAQCYAFLKQVDPLSVQKIHPNDAVRTLRALEVYYTTGKPISQQQGKHPPSYPILQIGLDCVTLDRLTQRIKQRTQQMLDAGLVAEVTQLCQKYGSDLPLLNTLGYQEMKQYLAGEISLQAAKEQIVLHTRQFAKRQRTWFHGDRQIEWFDADSPHLVDQVWARIQAFLQTCADYD